MNNHSKSKVLIVDDDKTICRLLTAFLTSKGYQTENVYSGEDALEVLDNESFDAVITDLQMYEISGFDVIRHVKDTSPETSLVMLTGSSCQNDRAKALKYGADNFLIKPVVLNELLVHLPPAHVEPVRAV